MFFMTFGSTSSSESLSPRSDIAFPNSTADINLDGDEAGLRMFKNKMLIEKDENEDHVGYNCNDFHPS